MQWLRDRTRPVAVGAAGLGAAAIAHAVEPLDAGWLPKCPFNMLTGLHCPGCGSTRALHELMHGDVVAAAHNNVAFLVLLPLLVIAWAIWFRSAGQRSLTMSPRFGIYAALGLTAFAVVRNIPALDFLAPVG